jgi:hypothetical protein
MTLDTDCPCHNAGPTICPCVVVSEIEISDEETAFIEGDFRRHSEKPLHGKNE